MKRALLYGFLLFGCLHLQGQDRLLIGALPGMNLSKGLIKEWKATLGIETRQSFINGPTDALETDFGYILTDFSLIASRKLGHSNGLAAGYLLRFRGEAVFHRFLQQLTLVRKLRAFRAALRLAADQTFSASGPATWRFRTRGTGIFPLNGQAVDAREFYFKLNHEYLHIFRADRYILEIRAVPLLGFAINDNNKLEAGLDYRLGGLAGDRIAQSIFVAAKWYLTL